MEFGTRPDPRRRLMGVGFVAVLHLTVLYLLVIGLAISIPIIVLSALLGLAPGQGAMVAAVMAVCTYFYAMPAWTGALAHFYRHSAAQ